MKTRLLFSLSMLGVLQAGAADPPPDSTGLPSRYSVRLAQLGVDIGTQDELVHTVFANDLAVSVRTARQLPYPDGAIIIMEFARPVLDADGKPRLEEGRPVKGDVQRIDIMRRVANPGAFYGDDAAGHWEFSEFAPDGKVLIAPQHARSCAACHRKAQDTDFVFRARRLPE